MRDPVGALRRAERRGDDDAALQSCVALVEAGDAERVLRYAERLLTRALGAKETRAGLARQAANAARLLSEYADDPARVLRCYVSAVRCWLPIKWRGWLARQPGWSVGEWAAYGHIATLVVGDAVEVHHDGRVLRAVSCPALSTVPEVWPDPSI